MFLRKEGDAWYLRALKPLEGRKHLDFYEESLSIILQAIVPNVKECTVVEVGASRGDRLGRLTNHLKCQGIAVEPSKIAVAEGQSMWQGKNIDFRIGIAEKTGLPPGSVSVLVYGWCLLYVEPASIGKVTNEMNRLLRKGAIVVVGDFDHDESVEIPYKHDDSMKTYRRDYGQIFQEAGLSLRYKVPMSLDPSSQEFSFGVPANWYDRHALWIFEKT